MDKIIIRPITQKDNAAIATIIRDVLTEHGANKCGTVFYDDTTDALFELFSAEQSAYFIAEQDNLIIGGAGIYPTKALPAGTCELVKMYLLAPARGKGIGKILMDTCLAFATRTGFKQVYLETMSELAQAIKLYEKNGFTPIANSLGDTGHFGCDIQMIKALAHE